MASTLALAVLLERPNQPRDGLYDLSWNCISLLSNSIKSSKSLLISAVSELDTHSPLRFNRALAK